MDSNSRQTPQPISSGRQKSEGEIKDWTKENLHSLFDIDTLIQTCKEPEKCWFGNSPTLGELRDKEGGSLVEGWIGGWMINLANYSGCSKKLDDKQLDTIGKFIVDKYGYLKITELMLFFYDFFRSPKKDVFFGAVDPDTIFYMLQKFIREKRGRAIRQHDIEQEQERIEREKDSLITWEEHCKFTGKDPNIHPEDICLRSFGVPKPDDMEKVKISARAIIENRECLNNTTLKAFRQAFEKRYKCTPEEFLNMEG